MLLNFLPVIGSKEAGSEGLDDDEGLNLPSESDSCSWSFSTVSQLSEYLVGKRQLLTLYLILSPP